MSKSGIIRRALTSTKGERNRQCHVFEYDFESWLKVCGGFWAEKILGLDTCVKADV